MKKYPLINGHVEPYFQAVYDSFKNNFSEGWEKGGSCFCVYHKGKKVVDLWGGYADKSCRRPWREESLTTIFSCTKSVTSICFSVLVDRGLCQYDDLVTKHWPEFGHKGKENITIQMVLTHRAGLPYIKNHKFFLEELVDVDKMSHILEEASPIVEPNTKVTYHPLTFGWLVDQIFRRIDTQKRTVGVFFKEEIAEKHRLDVHVGDTSTEEARVTRLSDYNLTTGIREIAYDRSNIVIASHFLNPKGYFKKATKNLANFGKNIFTMYNNSELRIVGQPAVNGLATARGLAELHQLFMDGTIVSKHMLEALEKPLYEDELDYTMGEKMSRGHGFFYTKSPTNTWQMGHMGVGGQRVTIDKDNDLVFCYLTNSMKVGSGEHIFTCNRLANKVYEAIKLVTNHKDSK